jgi:hypothetical protein
MRDIIHTKIGPALRDASTWGALTAAITAAAVLPAPWSYIVAAVAVPGILLKGGGNAGAA